MADGGRREGDRLEAADGAAAAGKAALAGLGLRGDTETALLGRGICDFCGVLVCLATITITCANISHRDAMFCTPEPPKKGRGRNLLELLRQLRGGLLQLTDLFVASDNSLFKLGHHGLERRNAVPVRVALGRGRHVRI